MREARLFFVSIGDSITSNQVKTKELEWEALTKRLSKFTPLANRTKGKYFVGGHFENDKRSDEFVIGRSLLTIDIDSYPGTYRSLLEYLVFNIDWAFFLYTTYRSTEDQPRIRLVIPLSRDVTGDEYRALSKAFCRTLEIEGIDPASFVPSQAMFLPASLTGEGNNYEQDGDFLDVDAFDLSGTSDEDASDDSFELAIASAPLDLDDEAIDAYLETYPAEGLEYDDWIEVGMALAHQYEGSDLGFDKWLAWSEKSSKHNASGMKKKYASVTSSRRTKPKTFATVILKAGTLGSIKKIASKAKIPLPTFLRDKKGSIHNTAQNCRNAVACSDIVGMTIGFDTFRDEIMYYLPGFEGEWQTFTDNEYFTIRMALDQIRFKDTTLDKVRGAVNHVSLENRFDSAQLWLGSLHWDGIPRVSRFCVDYLGAEDNNYTKGVSEYLWTGLAGRIIEPGVKADMVPVMVSPEGLRKSSAVLAMSPHRKFYTELNLSKNDADISRELRGVLIGEWPELGGMSKKDVEHIKAFCTKTTERWVPKYMELMKEFPRRCMFIGTTNDENFLVSNTGNRRFLPFVISQCNDKKIIEDRDQLWAEAAALFDINGVMWQEAHRLGKQYQEAHEEIEDWEDTISLWLDSPAKFELGDEVCEGLNKDRQSLSTVEVAFMALGLKASEVDKRVGNRIAKSLRRSGWENKPVRHQGRLRKRWVKKCPF